MQLKFTYMPLGEFLQGLQSLSNLKGHTSESPSSRASSMPSIATTGTVAAPLILLKSLVGTTILSQVEPCAPIGKQILVLQQVLPDKTQTPSAGQSALVVHCGEEVQLP